MNIQNISDSYLCSACGACFAACSRSAIEFQWSNLGRKYATVNSNCNDCGLCAKVCPKLNEVTAPLEPQKYYIGRSANKEGYHNAQSGGACTALVSYLLDNGKIDAAVMCRMDYGLTPDVHAVTVTSSQDLYACQKSCYTPVDILSALKETRKYKSVAVVGLPCHIQGASNLLKMPSYKNITYKIGLFCERTLCRTIQDTLISYSATNAPVKIEWKKKDFFHEGKSYDYKNAPLVIRTEDNKLTIMPNSVRFALKDDFTPLQCRVCHDKLNNASDVTFGDPWGMDGIDWQHGDSVILARTDEGVSILNEAAQAGYLNISERHNFAEVIQGQLMQKRIIQAATYSKAVNDSTCTDSEVVKARKDFENFKKREHLTKDEIVANELQVIQKALRADRLRHSALYRLYIRIKHLLH